MEQVLSGICEIGLLHMRDKLQRIAEINMKIFFQENTIENVGDGYYIQGSVC